MNSLSPTPEPNPSLDDLRRAFPALGFALYALDASGPVVFEVHDGPDVYSFTGLTASEAILAAFPEAAEIPVEADPPSVFD